MKKKLLLLLVLLNSCDIINPEEEIPGFIYIKEFNIITNEDQGSSSAKISDAWISIDNENIGVYPLPARIPILKNGMQTISIEAGIKVNGISASREVYPFYTSHNETINLQPNITDTIQPNISYNMEKIPFIEDFESNEITISIFSDSINYNINQIFTDTLKNLLGNYAGKITVNKDGYEVVECGTPDFFNLPDNVYLEMDYKCNVPIAVGLYANSNSQIEKSTIIYLNPQTNWNKTYISLYEYLAYYNNNSSYKIFFGMIRDTTQSENEMYLDNIKIVYEQE